MARRTTTEEEETIEAPRTSGRRSEDEDHDEEPERGDQDGGESPFEDAIDVTEALPNPARLAGDRLEAEERVVNTIISLDPEQLFDELEAAERVPLTLVSVMKQQTLVLQLANRASKLEMILRRDAKIFVEVEMARRMAELRARANEEMPREKTADGKKDKVATASAVHDYMIQAYTADIDRLTIRKVELEQLAEHASRIAKNWAYRSKTLESLSGALRSTGDAESGRRDD